MGDDLLREMFASAPKCTNCHRPIQSYPHATLSGVQEHIETAVDDMFPGTSITVTDTHTIDGGVVVAFDTKHDEQAVSQRILDEWRVVGPYMYGIPPRIQRMPSL